MNVVLILLAIVLIVATVLFWVRNPAGSGDSQADALSKQYTAVSKAAENETVAFLTVDYRDMDPLIEKVLAGATGPFKEQYGGAKANLKSSAETAKAVSTGKVRSVGISEIEEENAVVFVAADSQVSNKSTGGKTQPRYYRLKLTMVRDGGEWLTSALEFVG